jgi:hypothetical protein
MNVSFKALGLLLAGCVVMAVLSGTVYAKSAVCGRTFLRTDRPLRHWSTMAAHTLLTEAPMFWFCE